MLVKLCTSRCAFALPYCHYNLYKHSFVLRCIFDEAYELLVLLLKLLFSGIHCFMFLFSFSLSLLCFSNSYCVSFSVLLEGLLTYLLTISSTVVQVARLLRALHPWTGDDWSERTSKTVLVCQGVQHSFVAVSEWTWWRVFVQRWPFSAAVLHPSSRRVSNLSSCTPVCLDFCPLSSSL